MDADDILKHVKVVPHEKYLADIRAGAPVICMPASIATPLTDNLKGNCSMCGIAIQFRPHNLEATFKVCINCARNLGAQA